jgi:HPt (histidine-containing phosphotransfer) domain-containing protein
MDVKEKLYDLTFLKSIAGDDIDGLKDLIGKFLINTPNEIADLENALNAQDRSLAAKIAHKLKGNVKFFHIKHIFEPLREIENTCADEELSVDFAVFKNQLEDIKKVYLDVFTDLKEEIA